MPQSERQKAAWNIVHGIYRNPPVSAADKKRAWNTIHAAYSNTPILNPMTKGSKTITLMREEIPDREEDMSVKPISATAPPPGVSPIVGAGRTYKDAISDLVKEGLAPPKKEEERYPELVKAKEERDKRGVVVSPKVQAKSDKIYNLMFKLAKKYKTRDNVGEMEKLQKKIMDLSTEETRTQFPGVWENWYDLGRSDAGNNQKKEWSRYNMEHERKIQDDWESRHPEESKRLKMWKFFSTEG